MLLAQQLIHKRFVILLECFESPLYFLRDSQKGLLERFVEATLWKAARPSDRAAHRNESAQLRFVEVSGIE